VTNDTRGIPDRTLSSATPIVGGMSTTNPVNWFEIGVSDVEKSKAFYADLLGWRYTAEGDYTIVDCGDGSPIQGGMYAPGGGRTWALPYVNVPDVAAACERATELGAVVGYGPETQPNGIVVAHFRDLDGNLVGLYSMPPAA
jgi:predicted enzyme related to lactoylglutathione lyase